MKILTPWTYTCPLNSPLCKRDKPCIGCWKLGVAEAQRDLAKPRMTAPRLKVKPEKPVLLRKRK